MSIDLDFENSLKERFCFDDFSVDFVLVGAIAILFAVNPIVIKEERVGFEPTDRFRPSVFKTDAIDRSAISPRGFYLPREVGGASL